MKKTQIISLLVVATLLASCGGQSVEDVTLDVDSIVLDLPTMPEFNKGAIKSDENYDYIDIYETSDFHGAVLYNSEEEQIGITRLSSYFNKKREQNPGGTVIISGGDMWQGSAESNLTKGYMLTYSMNYMGFDSMTLGNHEFDWTDEWIKKNKDKATFPFLCANLVDKTTKTMPDFVKASTMIERGDYKIGIIGTIGSGIEGSILSSAIANYEFKEEAPIVKAEAAKLREAGADIVIWSSHYDINGMSTRSGSPVELGVNAVFGGHTHLTGNFIYEGVPYQETKNYGEAIAHVQLKIEKGNKANVSAVEEECVPDSSPCEFPGLSEEANVKSIFDQYNSHIEPIKQKKIGSTDAELKIVSTLGNLCCKAMGERANEWAKENNTGYEACLAMHNLNGGIRANLPQGDIHYGDVYKSFPFDNELVFIKRSGQQLYKDLAYGSFKTLGAWKTFKNKDDIDKTKDYYFVTTDYVATSSNFKVGATEADLIHTGIAVRDLVAKYIAKIGGIKSADYLAGKNHPEFGWNY